MCWSSPRALKMHGWHGIGWNFKADAEGKTDVNMEYEIMIKKVRWNKRRCMGKTTASNM